MTTKDYLDEYAELWEVQHKGSEDTVERNYRKLEELAKELEASIRKEVVEDILNIPKQNGRVHTLKSISTYEIEEYALSKGITTLN